MKKYRLKNVFIILIFIIFCESWVSAQVGIGTTTPNASAILDLTTTTQGLLPPRMTQAQRNTIVTPAAGLMVWCANCGASGELQVYNGTTWTNLTGGTASAAVPDAPTSPVATEGNAQASIAFTVPGYNGGSAITGYTVTSSPGNFTATGASSPIVVTGLTNGTAYTFTVVATNTVGNSSSAVSAAVTPFTIPSTPTSLVATAGNAQASVAFTASASNGGRAITGYTVTSSPGSFTATGPSSPLVVTGLTNGTAYTFTVVATNLAGNSDISSVSSPVTPFTVPSAPSSPVATGGDAQVSVAFNAPAFNGGSAITSYTVTSSPGSFTATGASSPLVVTGLTNGSSYTFTVIATNAAGNSNASSSSLAIIPLSCGTSVSFTYNGSSVSYGIVANYSTGKCWLDRNLGATQVATSSSDANAYGHLFQWGRRADGHQLSTAGTTTELSATEVPSHGNIISSSGDWLITRNDNLWNGVSAVNNPCPSGFRLPTHTELIVESNAWTSPGAPGAFASPLKLPYSGSSYWSGMPDVYFYPVSSPGPNASYLRLTATFSHHYAHARSNRMHVRCIKN